MHSTWGPSIGALRLCTLQEENRLLPHQSWGRRRKKENGKHSGLPGVGGYPSTNGSREGKGKRKPCVDGRKKKAQLPKTRREATLKNGKEPYTSLEIFLTRRTVDSGNFFGRAGFFVSAQAEVTMARQFSRKTPDNLMLPTAERVSNGR